MKRVLHSYILNPAFLGGVIVLVLSLIFFVVSLMVENRQKFTSISRASSNPMQIVPPVMYSDMSEIQIVPRRINDHFFSTRLQQEFRDLYPSLKSEELHALLVEHSVTWAALRDLYKINHLKLAGLEDFAETGAGQIEAELPLLLADYKPRIMKLEGFYLKTRFAGIYKEALKELNKDPGVLKTLAQSKVQEYVDEARKLSNPSTILKSFNADEMNTLMNNGELSKSFSEYQLDPPLFDDPDVPNTLEHAQIGQFTPISVLRTKNPMSPELEDYAYVAYYVTSRVGNFLPVDQITSEYLKVAVIR